MNRDELITYLGSNCCGLVETVDFFLARESAILDAVTAIAKKCDANLSPGRKLAEIKQTALSAIEKMRGEK